MLYHVNSELLAKLFCAHWVLECFRVRRFALHVQNKSFISQMCYAIYGRSLIDQIAKIPITRRNQKWMRKLFCVSCMTHCWWAQSLMMATRTRNSWSRPALVCRRTPAGNSGGCRDLSQDEKIKMFKLLKCTWRRKQTNWAPNEIRNKRSNETLSGGFSNWITIVVGEWWHKNLTGASVVW